MLLRHAVYAKTVGGGVYRKNIAGGALPSQRGRPFHASSMEDTTSAISGSCLTIVAAPSLLIARVCPLGDTVFALACLAGEERMRHLAALLVRWSLA